MPIKYIGRTTDFKGKPLWEILGNLKDFGVGRTVVRCAFERYPEPSFLKICKVQALANTEGYEDRKVKVWAEKVFRGRKYPDLVTVRSASYKADYRLLHKDEEESYCKKDTLIPLEKVKLLPRVVSFPPLLKEMILIDRRAKGEDTTKEPKMQMIYRESRDSLTRIARENEETDLKFDPGLGTPVSPNLYANIQRK